MLDGAWATPNEGLVTLSKRGSTSFSSSTGRTDKGSKNGPPGIHESCEKLSVISDARVQISVENIYHQIRYDVNGGEE